MRSAKSIELNFATKEVLQEAKVNEQAQLQYKTDVKCMYVAILGKIKERSSLKYALISNLDCLNPSTVDQRSDQSLKRKMEGCLLEFVSKKVMNTSDADLVKKEYRDFISEVKIECQEELRKFDVKTDRLDTFYYNICSKIKYPSLWKALKNVFILSHGQADVERGFSVNKELLRENMNEKTIQAHRIVYSGVLVNFILLNL